VPDEALAELGKVNMREMRSAGDEIGAE